MLLTAKYVIPITSPYIEDGAVLVRDDKILDLGPASQLKDKYPMEEVRDFGLSALMPGFVDLHTHLGYTALRGMFGDLPYADWKRHVLHTEPFFTEEDWIDSARVGALEAVASGITTIADISASGVTRIPAQEMGLRARVYYDGEMQWMRTEYFSPDDDRRARITFKPDDHRDAVIRFDYNDSTGKTKETVLFPVPYAFQTAEQSLQNAQFGDRLLLVADERGEYAYCPREEQQRRIKFLKQNKNASVMLSMGWEVKDGDVPETTEPESELPVFGNLTEPALVDFLSDPAEKAAEPTEENPVLEEAAPEEPASEAPEAEPQPETEPETKEVEESLIEDTPAEGPEEAPEEPAPVETPKTDPAPDITPEELRQARALLDKLLPAKEAEKEDDPKAGITLIRGGAPFRYTGDLSEDGKREGFGRTVNNNGITLYEGEYKNDLREGFGVHHYRSGAVSYIGDFKDDQREGFGVSFRESDHALHISHWQNGKPQGMATIFNKNGDLIYNGQIIDGQKQGAGVSVDPETHCVFVEKYENNEKAGQATLFDADGNLIYSGGWQNGKRQGHGTAFDKNGNVVYTGEWKDDRYENGILYRHVQNEDKA